MLVCCRKAGTAAFWLLLSAALAAGAFVICAASSSPEKTTMPVTSSESPNSYLCKKEVRTEAEKETPAGTGIKLLIGDIEKLKKVTEILQTVGEIVIQNNVPGNSESENIQNKTKSYQSFRERRKGIDDSPNTVGLIKVPKVVN